MNPAMMINCAGSNKTVCLDSLWLHHLYQMLVLPHGFDSLKRTFITLLSSAVKQSKGALKCPQTSLKGAKTLNIYISNMDAGSNKS